MQSSHSQGLTSSLLIPMSNFPLLHPSGTHSHFKFSLPKFSVSFPSVFGLAVIPDSVL